MKMTDITKNVIGYNNKTKDMSGSLVAFCREYKFVEVMWNTYGDESIHEFIKEYKEDIFEYVTEEYDLVFLPFKNYNSKYDYNEEYIYNTYEVREYGELENIWYDLKSSDELYNYMYHWQKEIDDFCSEY